MQQGSNVEVMGFTSSQLLDAIRNVLNDPGYAKRTKVASEIMRSRSQSPQQRAVYWIEHVVKFGDYLHSHATDMPLYEYLMIDLLAVIIIFVSIIITVVCFISFWCVCKLKRKIKQD